ncbi:MAG: hypothetical protein JNK05_35320 [Myxococcales bacterium]|nr:hypothetical protein [Myxococcales bacterium]
MRPVVLLSLVTALVPWKACHFPRRHTQHKPAARVPAATAATQRDAGPPSTRSRPNPDEIEIRIGTRGDRHPLPRGERQWEQRAARLVLNAPYQSWGDEGTFVHVIAYTPTLARCEQADFYLGNVHVGRGDEHGAFAFRRTGQTSNMLRVACRSADAKWYRGQIHYFAQSRSQEFERPVVYINADRGVYKPGQTIHVRALAWRLRGEYIAAPEQNVTISLEGPDGQPVGGARIHTDEDGIGTLDIQTPRNLPEGQYKLVATHIAPESRARAGWGGYGAPQETNRAEAPIQIRRFETPVIEVRHTLGEFLTPAMREVPFTVTLGYLDGAPFTSARLEVALGQGESRVALEPRSVTGPGPHTITLTEAQLARFRATPELRVELSATDATGRKDTVVRAMRVVDNPYRATLELDRNGYATGETVDVALRVTDLNSVVQRDKPVRVSGCNRELSGRTDDTGVAHFRFAMPASSCTVSAFASDARGAIATVSVTRTVVRPMQSRVLEQRVREREPVTINVNFPSNVLPVERVVHGDLTDSSGAIIDSLSIPIEDQNGTPRARAVIRPPSWGSMLVSLYTLGVERNNRSDPTSIGLLTDGQSIAVGAVQHLEVTLHGVGEELRPGAVVPLRINVTRDGAPATATLGVSVVDRGVINMLDPYEHPPFDRFYDPQQKVLASTGAQTLTWPVVQRTWGPDRYDIGWLPSFGMHRGGRNEDDPPVAWPDRVEARRQTTQPTQAGSGAIISPFGGLTESGTDGNMTGDAIGDAFGFGGLGATGTGWGGGGTGEGTIGLGNFGTMGHGSGTGTGQGYGSGAGSGLRARRSRASTVSVDAPEISAGGELQGTGGRRLIDEDSDLAEPVLIVRTGVDDTSLWLPRARGGASVEPLQVRVPDTIGEHQINVLASDRQGGIALARATLTVRQPLYVRADVPESLTAGDVATVTVVARNASENPVDLDLSLRAPQWTIEPLDATHVTVAARGQGTARFRVRAINAGPVRYEAEARGASMVDTLRADAWVRPSGTATHERVTATLRAGQPFEATVSAAIPGCVADTSNASDCNATYRVARLSIALPEATAWEAALDYGASAMSGDIEFAAHKFATLSSWADRASLAAAREAAESVAAQALFTLGGSSPSGGPNALPTNPRAIARVLASLALARRAGYPLRAFLLSNAQAQLTPVAVTSPEPGDRWVALRALIESNHEEYRASPWNGSRDQSMLDLANRGETLRAAIGVLDDAVVRTPRSFADALSLVSMIVRDRQQLPRLSAEVDRQIQARIQASRGADAALVAAGSNDAGSESPEAQSRAFVLLAARNLLAWRRSLTVEPGSAQGEERVYTTAQALLAMHAIAPDRAAAELREVSTFLRSQRARWEGWSSPETSAAALQALALAGTRPEREGATVIVKVDGREVRRVAIDPRDPWTSSLALRQIELDDELTQGTGNVTVEYNGALAANVVLDVERWSRRPQAESLRLTAPERIARGATLPLRVRATRPSSARLAEVWVTLPASARLDETALDRMVVAGSIASWRQRAGLVQLVFASGTTSIDAEIPCRIQRTGAYSIGAAELRDETGVRVGVTGATVTVD